MFSPILRTRLKTYPFYQLTSSVSWQNLSPLPTISFIHPTK